MICHICSRMLCVTKYDTCTLGGSNVICDFAPLRMLSLNQRDQSIQFSYMTLKINIDEYVDVINLFFPRT